MILRPLLISIALASIVASHGHAQQTPTREEQVRQDKQAFARNDAWIYDNLDAGIEEAKRTKRPLIIVFR